MGHGSGQPTMILRYSHSRAPDRGAAPSEENMRCLLCKLGSEGHEGCVGGGCHLYWEHVCIQSVSLRDGKQSHGTEKEGMRASGAGSHANSAEE